MNMNLVLEHEPQIVFSFFDGRYTDFSPFWYQDVGDQIYQTYFIQMLMPFINLIIEFTMVNIFHCMDSGICCDKRKSKSKNIHMFLDTYMGSDFSVNLGYLYADSLNVIFLAMFYGIGIPIMFPMAVIILMN